MRETGKPTFVLSDYYWRARLRARGSARSRGSQVVSTHGLNTQRMSAVQKVWSLHVYATILLQHGPAAQPVSKSRRKFLTVDASVVVHMRFLLLVCNSQKQTKATCRHPWSTYDRCKRAMSESVQKQGWTRRFV
jgi:hypothetical protein